MASISKGENKLSPTSASKKMKQTRLPFQLLSDAAPKSPGPGPTIKTPTSETRKRKPSMDSEGIRAAKIGRISEVKENVRDSDVVVIDINDESNSTDMVDVRKEDQKLVAVKVVAPRSPTEDTLAKGGEEMRENGTGKKKALKKDKTKDRNDKIMIKWSKDKKKGKKGETKEAGASKKKLKEKKKRARTPEANPVEEVVIADDSDMTDTEKDPAPEDAKNNSHKENEQLDNQQESDQGNTSVSNELGEIKTEKHKNDKEVDAQSHPISKSSNCASADAVEKKLVVIIEPIVKNPEIDESVGIVEPLVTPNRAKQARVAKGKESDAQSSSPGTDNSDTIKMDDPVVIVEEQTTTPKRPRSMRNSLSNKKSVGKAENSKETKRAKKSPSLSKALADKSQENANTESGKQESNASPNSPNKSTQEVATTASPGTPMREKSARISSSMKKVEATKSDTKPKSSKKSESQVENQNQKKPVKGALEKFFGKVPSSVAQTEAQDDVKEEPAQKTPEKCRKSEGSTPMEVDQEQDNPNNSTIVCIGLDDSSDNNAADDVENAYMLCTPNSKERALSVSSDKKEKKLTPKQLARRQEFQQRQAQKLQEIEEKKKKRQEEKECRAREKEELERLKKKEREDKEEQKRKEKEEKEEQKRKEKEQKEEQRRKEKEEKEKKRLAEIEAKNEERRKKDEQKEEERRKKEEEKEAEEKRKQKTAQAFQSFFVKKATSKEVKLSDDENSMETLQIGEADGVNQNFMPFCVKGDMRLAPVCRAILSEERKQRLDEILANLGSEQKEKTRDELYLANLKVESYVVSHSDRTWIAQDEEAEEDDVMIVDDEVCHQIETDPAAVPSEKHRAKFFLFEENRRPAFRGTWRKRSALIKARRPFAQDTKYFDYEVDSDDEWEEEEPGESLHGSDDEKDVDPEEEYEVDNDFFVPHGHLSDEEMRAEDDVLDDNSPEAQKAKLKIMQQEFAAEMKKKTEKIKPRLIGCIWENVSADGDDRPECSAVIWEILKARAMLFNPEEPISFTVQKNQPDSNQSTPSKEKEPAERKLKQVKLVDEGVKELITLIHGSSLNRQFLIKEFLAYWAKRRDEGEFSVPQFAPDSIRIKISEISSWRPCPDEGPMQNKMCWYVYKDTLVKYGLEDLKAPTDWQFTLKPIVKSKKVKKPKTTPPAATAEEEVEQKQEEEKKPPLKKKSREDKHKKERLQSSLNISGSKTKTAASNIKKFTKHLSEDDKRKQFAKRSPAATTSGIAHRSSKPKGSTTPKTKPAGSTESSSKVAADAATVTSTASNAKPQPKKRVPLLMSVPRGQTINQTTKNNLISQFLAKGDHSKKTPSDSSTQQEKMEVDPPSGQSGVDPIIILDE